ncbi:Hypothetical predicted protein [Olea europaea subsp. europaea]|uniref:DUF1985 domain-containing protein n=1 Tax=Olea europaea subsp. europaea TaxID=158383 RepID=A0A8S0QYU0_OLEEU|nr:Hypothetical predicted protein [Olea europaea subsp. europaea]
MEFEFMIPKDAQLWAHISQRSNLIYVKIVMDHFDERQHEDFRNFPLGYLAEVPDIQFLAQLILQLVFRSVRTEEVNKLWYNVQGHLMRYGLQVYTLVTGLRCGLFPEGDDFDRLIERKRLKERLVLIVEGVFNAPDNNVSIYLPTLSIVDDLDFFFTYPWGKVRYRRLLHGFRGSLARKFQKAKRRKEKEITCTVHGFPIAMQFGHTRQFWRLGNASVSESVNECHDFFACNEATWIALL